MYLVVFGQLDALYQHCCAFRRLLIVFRSSVSSSTMFETHLPKFRLDGNDILSIGLPCHSFSCDVNVLHDFNVHIMLMI